VQLGTEYDALCLLSQLEGLKTRQPLQLQNKDCCLVQLTHNHIISHDALRVVAVGLARVNEQYKRFVYT